jgi:hypothetical protein
LDVTIHALGLVVYALFPLPFIAVLLYWVGQRTHPSARWENAVDLPLTLLSGLAFLVVSAFWIAPMIVVLSPLMSSDFGQYCESVGAFRDGDLSGWIRQRSLVAGALPGALAGPLGIVDGLLMGAWISHWVMGVGLFLWGRAAHSRMAGIMTCLLGCAVHPVVYLSRTVSFYPEVIAICVLSSGLALLALRERRWPMVLAAGLGIGLVLLVDARGLIFAGPVLTMAVLAVVTGPRRHRWPSAGVLIACMVGSYQIGHHTTWSDSVSLELQTLYYVDDALRHHSPGKPEGSIMHEAEDLDSRFVWGRTPLTTLPATLNNLLYFRSVLPEDIADVPHTSRLRRNQVNPWLMSLWLSVLVAGWGLRHRPLLGFGFLVSLLPYALALEGAARVLVQVRYLASGLVMVPVMMAVGFAVLAQGALERQDRSPEQRWLSRPEWVGLALVLVLVVGVLPTWLAPQAPWRVAMSVHHEPGSSVWHASTDLKLPSDISRSCIRQLQRDFEQGFPVGSRLVGWNMTSAPSEALNPIEVHPLMTPQSPASTMPPVSTGR